MAIVYYIKYLKNNSRIQSRMKVKHSSLSKLSKLGKKGNKWIRRTAALLARPGDSLKNNFDLPEHVERDQV